MAMHHSSEDAQEMADQEMGEAGEEPSEAQVGAQEELAALRLQLEDAHDKMLRALADADNARKRAQKDVMDAKRYASAALAKEVLVILDDLRRCLGAVAPQELSAFPGPAQDLVEGVKIILRSFEGILERQGLQKIEPEAGDKFDPEVHEALFETNDSGMKPGCVVQILEVGYRLSDRLLRPARVSVSS